MVTKSSGSDPNAQIAEAVFGWKNVHAHNCELVGEKPDKLGRMRSAKVPDYAGDPTQAHAIHERMKQLGKRGRISQTACTNNENQRPSARLGNTEQRVRAALAVPGAKRKRK